jgi:hypothetical protein
MAEPTRLVMTAFSVISETSVFNVGTVCQCEIAYYEGSYVSIVDVVVLL